MKFAKFLIAFLFLLVLPACTQTLVPPADISLSQAITLSQNHNIAKAVIEPGKGQMTITAVVSGESLEITGLNGQQIKVASGTTLLVDIDGLNIADLKALGFVLPNDFSTTATTSDSSSSWLNYLPLLFLVFLFFILFRSGRGVQSQVTNFSRSRARINTGNTPSVTFDNVAGVEEAKQDLREVVDFLKNRAKFQALGARIPKGVLLIGPPGTGKTLLARAVAGEAGVPFFSISGSEFVEMFVGVGAARVRDLFDQAKRNAPCIIFIDEIDAVGRQRGVGLVASHDEREQTLNQILTEMDGFTPNTGVIVLAATNRLDVLDPALLRPGRFDRRVTLDLPDINGRIGILKVHAKGKPIAEDVDLEVLAKETHGFSGADLANLVNEAAILSARRNKKVINMTELEESIDRVIAGPERRSLKINPKDKETTAYHEAGHALVAYMLPNANPVRKISIVARGAAGGFTRLLSEDRYLMTKSQFSDTLATLLAGHTAEEMIFGEVSTGPHSDIKQATTLARKMVTDYGMSNSLSLRTFGSRDEVGYMGAEPRDYGDEVAKQLDEEVNRIINEAHERARTILQQNKIRLIHLAKKLLVLETLEGNTLEAAFTEPIPEETPGAIHTL